MTQTEAAPQSPYPVYPPVEEYRQILLWPLALMPSNVSGLADGLVSSVVEEQGRRMEAEQAGPWRRIKDPLIHLPNELGEPLEGVRQEPYAEFVYFHDFVQRFLYPDPTKHADGKSGLQIFNRSDVRSVRIEVDSGRSYELRVDRCNLYLFRMGVALLAVEVTSEGSDEKLDLRNVMELENIFRRVYTPYFLWEKASETNATKPGRYVPGEVPKAVTWLGPDGNRIPGLTTSMPHSVEEAVKSIASPRREPPVFDHWANLLGLKLHGVPSARQSATDISWRHVVDERMPFMAYIRLPATHSISVIDDGDWARLCFADPTGEKSPTGSWPYDRGFLHDFEHEHCYDRFKHWGTRHLFAGFSYLVVCSADNNENFALNVIRHHFRHMYFQMALIAHLEFATYLTFSSRLSRATEDGGVRAPQFREHLLRIHEDFQEFVHLFRFTGISNQMQARDMFDQWRKHLRLDSLLADVNEELQAATNYHLAKQAARQADAANRLNVIAILGLGAGLAFAFLGMNVIWTDTTLTALNNLLKPITPSAQPAWQLLWLGSIILSTILATATLGTWYLAKRLFHTENIPATEPHMIIERIARRMLWALAVVFLVSASFLFT